MARGEPQAGAQGVHQVSLQQKALALHVKAATAADDATLTAIRQYTLRDFAADELQIRDYALAHNCIDRDNEVFDEAVLDDFGRTLPGKGVYIRHPTSWQGDGGPAEGRVFAANTQTMSLDELRTLLNEPDLQLPPDRTTAKLLTARAFFAKTPDNASLLIKQDAGIAGDVSIGFSAQGTSPISDASGNELTARRWMAPAKAMEMSLVWLGAQPGARAIKSANTDNPPEQTMTLTPDQITALQAKAAQGEKDAGMLAALKSALGDADAALLGTPNALKALIADARTFKAALIADVVALERQLKICGDTDEAVKDAKTFHEDLPVAKLQAMVNGYESRLPQQGAMKGAATNAGAPGSQEPAKDSPLNNAAIA